MTQIDRIAPREVVMRLILVGAREAGVDFGNSNTAGQDLRVGAGI
jgi:hypothetical protein